MQRTTELKVDGKRYVTTQYSAGKGLSLLTRLAKVVGRPLGMIVLGKIEKEGKDASDFDSVFTPEIFGAIIESVAGQIDEGDVVVFVQDILCTTEIIQDDGKRRKIEFNIDFAGAYGHLFRLIKEVLAFQYGDFFVESVAQDEAVATPKVRIKARG